MQSATLSEQAPAAGPPRTFLPSLNGGRAIAALLVFGGHYLAMQFSTPVGTAAIYTEGAGRGATDNFFFHFFSWLVPVPINYFFVLSGFVLAWIYRPDRTARSFWRGRFARVYPAYIFTMVIAFVFFGVVADLWTSWKVVLSHIFLLQAWTPDQNYLLALNPVMWTLSSEAFLYLLFPALMVAMLNARTRTLQWVAAVCVVASFVVPYLATMTFTIREPAPPALAPLEGYDNAFSYWFILMFPPLRLFQFALGICLALLMRKSTKYAPSLPVAAVAFVVGLWITIDFLPIELQNTAGMLVPIAMLIAALVKADLKGKWTPFRSRPLLFIGKISYSFYAVHILLILATMVMIPVESGAWDWPREWLRRAGVIETATEALPGWANVLLFFSYMSLTIVLAWLVNKWVEDPMARLIRGRSEKRKQPSTGAAQPQGELVLVGSPAGAADTTGTESDRPGSSPDAQDVKGTS